MAKTQPVYSRLTPADAATLRRVARQNGLSPAAQIKVWVEAQLESEREASRTVRRLAEEGKLGEKAQQKVRGR